MTDVVKVLEDADAFIKLLVQKNKDLTGQVAAESAEKTQLDAIQAKADQVAKDIADAQAASPAPPLDVTPAPVPQTAPAPNEAPPPATS